MKYIPEYEKRIKGYPACLECHSGLDLACTEGCEKVSHYHKCDGCGRQRFKGYID